MEFPLRLTRWERALAAALLVPVLWVAWLESRSPAAAAARTGQPWACWLALEAPATALPQIFLAYYRPAERTLDLMYVAENMRLEDGKTLPQVAAAARKAGAASASDLAAAMTDAARRAFAAEAPDGLREPLSTAQLHEEPFMPDSVEPPLAAKDWLRAQLGGASLLRRLRTGPRRAGALRGFELLRIGAELRRLSDDQLRAVYLPEDPSDRAAYLTGLEEPTAAPPGGASGAKPVTVEILNATDRSGIANAAKKILRSRGADVMSTGNAPARARTLVVDRVGRPELAARVRRMLGCPTAQALSQMDAKRLVDVSVVVADDCASRE